MSKAVITWCQKHYLLDSSIISNEGMKVWKYECESIRMIELLGTGTKKDSMLNLSIFLCFWLKHARQINSKCYLKGTYLSYMGGSCGSFVENSITHKEVDH